MLVNDDAIAQWFLKFDLNGTLAVQTTLQKWMGIGNHLDLYVDIRLPQHRYFRVLLAGVNYEYKPAWIIQFCFSHTHSAAPSVCTEADQ